MWTTCCYCTRNYPRWTQCDEHQSTTRVHTECITGNATIVNTVSISLVQPLSMPACSTFVPPSAPSHVILPPVVGMPAKGFGTSVIPVLLPVVQAIPSMLVSATPTILSVPNVTSLTQFECWN